MFSLARQFLNLVLPAKCPICHLDLSTEKGEPPPFCGLCSQNMIKILGPCCPTCGRPLPSGELLDAGPGFRCGDCRLGHTHLDGARAFFYFAGPTRDAIHLFKYHGFWRLGRGLAALAIGNQIKEWPYDASLILPVPLDSFRLRKRGFNQAVVLGRSFSEVKGIPMALDLIVRTKRVPPQVGLRGKERLKNIRGCFKVTHPEKIEGQKVLLSDDVVTTGATANECARILKKSGADRVYLFALAGTFQSPAGIGLGKDSL
ncbi:MAG: ComF family protein [bacterium]